MQVMRALLLGEVALPAPLRPVATVLRQLLNQQATLATIALEVRRITRERMRLLFGHA